jgi:hypothetical protein
MNPRLQYAMKCIGAAYIGTGVESLLLSRHFVRRWDWDVRGAHGVKVKGGANCLFRTTNAVR